MIDVNLQIDLANKEERDKIRDAKDKVGDVVETVKNAIDKNNVGTIKENLADNRFVTRGANAVEDDLGLSKALENYESLSLEQKYTVMIALADKMYKANGFDHAPDIVLTDGKTQRGEDTGVIYINPEQLAGLKAGDLIGVIAHETAHGTDHSSTEENFAFEKGDRANEKFDKPKNTGDVDLGVYLTNLEGQYAEEKNRLNELKGTLPEEKGEAYLIDLFTNSEKLYAPTDPNRKITYEELVRMNEAEQESYLEKASAVLNISKYVLKSALKKLMDTGGKLLTEVVEKVDDAPKLLEWNGENTNKYIFSDLDNNKVNHILNGSKGTKDGHAWEALFNGNKPSYEQIKPYIQNTLDNGNITKSIKTPVGEKITKVIQVNGYDVWIEYLKKDDVIDVVNAGVNNWKK